MPKLVAIPTIATLATYLRQNLGWPNRQTRSTAPSLPSAGPETALRAKNYRAANQSCATSRHALGATGALEPGRYREGPRRWACRGPQMAERPIQRSEMKKQSRLSPNLQRG